MWSSIPLKIHKNKTKSMETFEDGRSVVLAGNYFECVSMFKDPKKCKSIKDKEIRNYKK